MYQYKYIYMLEPPTVKDARENDAIWYTRSTTPHFCTAPLHATPCTPHHEPGTPPGGKPDRP